MTGALAVGCGETQIEDAPRRSAPAPTDLSDLVALGYGGWDPLAEGADASGSAGSPIGAAPWPGERVFTDDRSTVYAVNEAGEVRETLFVPRRTQVEFARPLQGGRMLTLSVDEGIDLFEPDGTLVWSLDLAAHHEAAVVPRDGDVAGARLFAVAVHDARSFRGRIVRFDSVVFVEEATGQVSSAPGFEPWSTWEHREALDAAAAGPAHPLSVPPTKGRPISEPEATSEDGGKSGPIYDYFHLNGIAFEGPQSMVVCLRNVSVVAAIALPGGTVRWALEPGLLDWPHAPSIVQGPGDGPSVLVFDNGTHRGFSRVLLVDPTDSSVQFEWKGTPERPLWTRTRGFVEELPNRHLLVTESERGRCVEIDRHGRIVWEFLNPEVRGAAGAEEHARRRIYRLAARPR